MSRVTTCAVSTISYALKAAALAVVVAIGLGRLAAVDDAGPRGRAEATEAGLVSRGDGGEVRVTMRPFGRLDNPRYVLQDGRGKTLATFHLNKTGSLTFHMSAQSSVNATGEVASDGSIELNSQTAHAQYYLKAKPEGSTDLEIVSAATGVRRRFAVEGPEGFQGAEVAGVH